MLLLDGKVDVVEVAGDVVYRDGGGYCTYGWWRILYIRMVWMAGV
jgi:hypothetical protein